MRKKSNLLVSAVLLMVSSSVYAGNAYNIVEIKNSSITEENAFPENNLTFAF